MRKILLGLLLVCLLAGGGWLWWNKGEKARIRTIVTLTDEGGNLLMGEPVRMVYGFEPNPRTSSAGNGVVTGSDGKIVYLAGGRMKRRLVMADGGLPKVSRYVELGVEMEMAGRPVLYWLEFDKLDSGVVRSLTAYTKDEGGDYTVKMAYDPATKKYYFPDEMGGGRFDQLGMETGHYSLVQEGTLWTLRVDLRKRLRL